MMAEPNAAVAELVAMRNDPALRPAIYKTLGITVLGAEPGRVRMALPTSAELANPLGAVAGGVTATVLDTALAWAASTRAPDSAPCVTQEIKINFVRPVDIGARDLIVTASILHEGRRSFVGEARLAGSDGAVYAIGLGTCVASPR